MPFGLSDETLSKMNEVFKKYAEIESVLIYGSRAKGTFRPGSDIDITIVAPTMTHNRLLKLEIELDDLLLPYKMDISLLHHLNDASFLEHINRVGKVFFENA